MTVVFLVLATIALVMAIHPLVTYPLSLVLLAYFRDKPQQPANRSEAQKATPVDKDRPKVAILLCVRNEENVIGKRIENLLALADSVPGTRILVYSDYSTDSSVDILKTYQQRITLVEATEHLGKTHGMNLLVERTDAQFLVFTDAAVSMNTQALTNVIRHFDDPDVGCVCGKIVASVSGGDELITSTASTSIKYWAFDATVRRLETCVASVIGAHGPLFAIRRDLHEPVPVELFDDFYLSMAILYNGHRVVQAEDFIGVKAVATKSADEFRRKIRVACQAFNVHRQMAPRLQKQTWLIRYMYAGHKTLRWMTIFSFAGAAVFFTLALLTTNYAVWALAVWAMFAVLMGLGYLGIQPFSMILQGILHLVATGIGVVQSIRGTVYQTWSSAASARRG